MLLSTSHIATHWVFFWWRKAVRSANPIPLVPIRPQRSLSLAPIQALSETGIAAARVSPTAAVVVSFRNCLLFELMVFWYYIIIINKIRYYGTNKA
jgi:hypothetical protein